MRRTGRLLGAALAIGALSLFAVGCKNGKDSAQDETEHPGAEHPQGEHPQGEHPQGEHPGG